MTKVLLPDGKGCQEVAPQSGIYNLVKYRHSRNHRLCRVYVTWNMYFPNEAEDNFYLLGIPIPRFLVSIYIYLLDASKYGN